MHTYYGILPPPCLIFLADVMFFFSFFVRVVAFIYACGRQEHMEAGDRDTGQTDSSWLLAAPQHDGPADCISLMHVLCLVLQHRRTLVVDMYISLSSRADFVLSNSVPIRT